MRFKAVISAVLALSVVCPQCVTAKQRQSEILYNESFNSYVTNEIPAGYSLPSSGFARISANEKKTDKALMIKSECEDVRLDFVFDNTEVKTNTGELTDRTNDYTTRNPYLISSVDISAEGDMQPIDISYYDSTISQTVTFVKISKTGEIDLYNGKKIGTGIDGTDTNIAIGCDLYKNTFFVAINGRKEISDWALPGMLVNPSQLVLNVSGGNGSGAVYIDNVRVYTGTKIRNDIPEAAYNDAEMSVEEIQETVGTSIFLKNDFEAKKNPTNGLAPIRDKNNKISVEYDALEDNHYLLINKLLSGDPFCDVKIQAGCKNVVSEMDIKVTRTGAKISPFYIRDTATISGQQINFNALTINPDLSVTSLGKTVYHMQKNTWYHIAAVFNISKQTMELYINNEKLLDNARFSSNGMKTINLVRFTLSSGNYMGEVCIDNYNVYEGTEIRDLTDNGEYVSIYSNGDAEKAILKDKTALQAYSDNGFKNNEKVKLSYMPIVGTDGTVYAAEKDIEYLFDGYVKSDKIAAIEKDGVTYADIAAYASEVLGKEVYNDGNGLIAASDTVINVSADKAQSLNDYIFYNRPSAAEIEERFNAVNASETNHPRVLATKSDFERIKNTRDADYCMSEWVNGIIKDADIIVGKPQTVKYEKPDGLRLLDVCRAVLTKMEKLGFAWQITGDTKYPERAWHEIEAVLEFPDWNPGHALDMGEMSAAFGIAYDWMYDGFSEEQREKIANALKSEGLTHIRNSYYGRNYITGTFGRSDTFATWGSNFNTVINGGGVVGALAIAETDKEFCFDIVEKAIRSFEYVPPLFLPNGSWEEGVMYWGYNAVYLEKFMGTLDTALGTDFGITNAKGMKDTVMYAISQTSWEGINNFHDAAPGGLDMRAISWLAKKFDNADVMRYRRFAYENYNKIYDVYDPIFYDPEKAKGSPELPLDHYTKGIEAAASRGSFEDREALYFAAHAGPTTCYHSQDDVGTFVFDLLGVRWAMDFGKDSYTTLALARDLYMKRPEGHNTIVINPDEETGQIANTYSPMIRYESKPKGSIFVYDMSEPYSDDASKVLRGFMTGDERRSLTIRDEIDLKANNSTVYWFMQTKADVEVTQNGAILRKDERELKLEFDTNAKAEITAAPAAPLPSSPHLEEDKAKLAGVNRIAIKLEGSGSVYLTVKLSALDEAVSDIEKRPIEEWTIPDGELVKRESIKPDMLYRDGKPFGDFDGDKTLYEIILNEGDRKPEITVSADGKPTEIREEDDRTVVTVYNGEDKTYKRSYIITYRFMKSMPELSGYKRLAVAGLSVGSEPEPQNRNSNMLDGDINTRWTTYTEYDTAVFDLGESKQIDKIAVSFWKGDSRVYKYEIRVSDDNVNYTTVFDGQSAGTTSGMEFVNMQPAKGRYVQLIGKGNSVNANTNCQEFAILQQ